MATEEQVQQVLQHMFDSLHCPGCGMRVIFGDLECAHCGADLDEVLRQWAANLLDDLEG